MPLRTAPTEIEREQRLQVLLRVPRELAPDEVAVPTEQLDSPFDIDALFNVVRPLVMDISGGPPSEFLVFPPGVFDTIKGDYLFDPEAAKAVMDVYQARGLDLMMDYEHMSLYSPPIISPAAAKRFVPVIKSDGSLWATEVAWTRRAQEFLSEGEYRFFSPAFDFDPKTRRIVRLINIALTNNPATNRQRPLVAASAAAKDSTTMPKKMKMKCSGGGCTSHLTLLADDSSEELKAFDGEEGEDKEKARARNSAYCKACLDAKGTPMSTPNSPIVGMLTSTFGLRSDAVPSELVEVAGKLAGYRRELLSVTGAESMPAALGMIQGWKEKSALADRLAAQLDKEQQGARTATLKALLDHASAKGVVTPGKRAEVEARAKDKAGNVTAEGLETLTALLSVLGPIPGGGSAEHTPPEQGLELTAQEREIAIKTGSDLTALEAYKRAKLSGGAQT